jgi:uncharacterized protein (UPF0332 family)
VTPAQRDLLRQARRSIAAAKANLELGYPEVAAARSYYAMFYCASSLLQGEGMAFSRHSAVIAAFGHHFARTGKVPQELHKFLISAEKVRLDADYVVGGAISVEEAFRQIARAEQFLAATEAHIGKPPPDSLENGEVPHR